MEMRAFFKQMATSPSLMDYAERKLDQVVGTYIHRPIEIQLTFSLEGQDRHARVKLKGPKGWSVQVEAEDSASMYRAIDKLQDRLEEVLRRKKEKRMRHKASHSMRLQSTEGSGSRLPDDAAIGYESLEPLDAAYIIRYERLRHLKNQGSMEHS